MSLYKSESISVTLIIFLKTINTVPNPSFMAFLKKKQLILNKHKNIISVTEIKYFILFYIIFLAISCAFFRLSETERTSMFTN